jgi:hypothetical protein
MSYYFNRLRKKPNYSRARNELSASVFTISMGSSSRVCCRGWVVKGGNPGRNIRVRLCLFDHFAEIVGQENVIAGTDCGLGGRVHPQIAWAKLRALRDGAAIASKKLWS